MLHLLLQYCGEGKSHPPTLPLFWWKWEGKYLSEKKDQALSLKSFARSAYLAPFWWETIMGSTQENTPTNIICQTPKSTPTIKHIVTPFTWWPSTSWSSWVFSTSLQPTSPFHHRMLKFGKLVISGNLFKCSWEGTQDSPRMLTPKGPQGPQGAFEGRKVQIGWDCSNEAQNCKERTMAVFARWIQ